MSGAHFVVAALGPAGTGSPSPSAVSRDITVTTTNTTTYTKTVPATPSAFVVGVCVTALGTADDTGTVAARSIALRPKVNGTCTVTFGRGVGGANA